MTDATPKQNILLIGGGSVGTIVALNLEAGGLANVTVVCRSNYDVVKEKGYSIDSVDHGKIQSFKPYSVRNTVPDVSKEELQPYDYIVVATKNIPGVGRDMVDIVRPALRRLPGNGNANKTTAVVLIQNGLNIEKPYSVAFPGTPIISGVSLIGAAEPEPGSVVQDDHDRLFVGVFPAASSSQQAAEQRKVAEDKARQFVSIYGAARKTQIEYRPNVLKDRWQKLVYNATLNPICALTGLDTGRIRLVDGGATIEGLVKPAMREIVAAAKAVAGVELDEGVVEQTVELDPLMSYLRPSMLQDLAKGNFLEIEYLVGEPLREGKKHGVPMPTLEAVYQMARAVQWRISEERGIVRVPEKKVGK